jgi:hypothetical protein
MSKHLEDIDFELSRTEKLLRLLSLIFLMVSFLLTIFFQKGRYIPMLIYPIGFFYVICSLGDSINRVNFFGIFFKPARFLLILLCLLTILSNFGLIYFELILNIEFVKVNNTWNGMNHPIASWLLNWQLAIFVIAMFTFPLLSIRTQDDKE